MPRQLPPAVRRFTGRVRELRALSALTREVDATGGTVVIIAIDSMAGVGKSALAVRVAHQIAGRFPDGQLFIDLHGHTKGIPPTSADDALGTLLTALGVPADRMPSGLDARAALYRQRLAGSRTLILLDNAASEAQVRPLVPAATGCLVLVTSRRKLKALDDACPLPLGVLAHAEAVELLRGSVGDGQEVPDDDALRRIAEACAGLPLALRGAATLLRHRTARELADLLADERHRLAVLDDGELDDGELDVSGAFDLSYQELSDEHRRSLRLRAGAGGRLRRTRWRRCWTPTRVPRRTRWSGCSTTTWSSSTARADTDCTTWCACTPGIARGAPTRASSATRRWTGCSTTTSPWRSRPRFRKRTCLAAPLSELRPRRPGSIPTWTAGTDWTAWGWFGAISATRTALATRTSARGGSWPGRPSRKHRTDPPRPAERMTGRTDEPTDVRLQVVARASPGRRPACGR
jgi:hypothetical protein